MEDPADHVAAVMFDLVEDMKRGDVEAFDARCRADAAARAELRQQHGSGGLTASELLKLVDGDDPEAAKRKLDADLDRMKRESDAEAEKHRASELAPGTPFPPPPEG